MKRDRFRRHSSPPANASLVVWGAVVGGFMVAEDADRGDVHYQPPASVIKSNINYAACSLQAQKLRGPALSLDASDWSKKPNNNSRKKKNTCCRLLPGGGDGMVCFLEIKGCWAHPRSRDQLARSALAFCCCNTA